MSDDTSERKPTREDYVRALQSMNSFIDVGVDDLMTLADRARAFAAQRATESLGASDIMTHPVCTVTAQTSMSEAAHLMVSERISGLPVVDGDGRLVGIITEADFLRGLGLPAHHPTQSVWQSLEAMFSHLAQHTGPERPDDLVADHMVREVVCASLEQDVYKVLELMSRHRVKRVLVCDVEHRVLGVVTRSDLVRVFFDRYRKTDTGD